MIYLPSEEIYLGVEDTNVVVPVDFVFLLGRSLVPVPEIILLNAECVLLDMV